MFGALRVFFAVMIAGISSGFPSAAETVGIFYDAGSAQAVFAANEVRTRLAGKSFTIEMSELAKLTSAYPNKKIIITLAANAPVIAQMVSEGGTAATSLGEQAYALRTTASPQKSYWALGGDANGAMYGGLQIAENLKSGSFLDSYASQESPYILRRGIRLNLPMDQRSPTYSGNNNGTSHQNAIPNVWDLTFWTSWFDEMAKNRYNAVSLWTDHPFTAMVKMPAAGIRSLERNRNIFSLPGRRSYRIRIYNDSGKKLAERAASVPPPVPQRRHSKRPWPREFIS